VGQACSTVHQLLFLNFEGTEVASPKVWLKVNYASGAEQDSSSSRLVFSLPCFAGFVYCLTLQPGMGFSDLQTLIESEPLLCMAGV
jgi:hypothetical protein